jgi:hypothetical protein
MKYGSRSFNDLPQLQIKTVRHGNASLPEADGSLVDIAMRLDLADIESSPVPVKLFSHA